MARTRSNSCATADVPTENNVTNTDIEIVGTHDPLLPKDHDDRVKLKEDRVKSVSYTHLTLPTSDLV